MALLQEYNIINTDVSVLQEQLKNNGKIVIKDVLLQRADHKNQNRRVYPKHILEREVNKYKESINERRAFGELDHPNSEVISLSNLSHLITDIWWKDNAVMGKMEILPTNSGKILEQLLLAGVKIGTSSRGLGSLKEVMNEGDNEPILEVQDDYSLICWDAVSTPSVQGAYVIKEGKLIQEEIVDIKLQKMYDIDKIMNEILLIG